MLEFLKEDITLDFSEFKERKVKAKSIFKIIEIGVDEAYNFILNHHYLADVKFMSHYRFGLYHDGVLVGVATYSTPNGSKTIFGWFGIEENQDVSILELSRLCVLPCLNGTNATSFLLSNSIKALRKYGIRAVITLADASRHVGSIYQVCNFKYFGLSAPKADFYYFKGNGNFTKKRGVVKHLHGVWVNRSQKHRYAYILDKSLKCLYDEQPYPNKGLLTDFKCCTDKIVIDNRYKIRYTCPVCTNKLNYVGKCDD